MVPLLPTVPAVEQKLPTEPTVAALPIVLKLPPKGALVAPDAFPAKQAPVVAPDVAVVPEAAVAMQPNPPPPSGVLAAPIGDACAKGEVCMISLFVEDAAHRKVADWSMGVASALGEASFGLMQARHWVITPVAIVPQTEIPPDDCPLSGVLASPVSANVAGTAQEMVATVAAQNGAVCVGVAMGPTAHATQAMLLVAKEAEGAAMPLLSGVEAAPMLGPPLSPPPMDATGVVRQEGGMHIVATVWIVAVGGIVATVWTVARGGSVAIVLVRSVEGAESVDGPATDVPPIGVELASAPPPKQTGAVPIVAVEEIVPIVPVAPEAPEGAAPCPMVAKVEVVPVVPVVMAVPSVPEVKPPELSGVEAAPAVPAVPTQNALPAVPHTEARQPAVPAVPAVDPPAIVDCSVAMFVSSNASIACFNFLRNCAGLMPARPSSLMSAVLSFSRSFKTSSFAAAFAARSARIIAVCVSFSDLLGSFSDLSSSAIATPYRFDCESAGTSDAP